MATFAPVCANGESTRCSIEIGEPASAAQTQRQSPKRWVERLRTQAAFHAALAGTGRTSAYDLERCFSPNRPCDGETLTGWAERRDRYWDRWQRGESTVPGLLRRGAPAAMSRLDAIRSVTPLVDQVLQMELWRCLEPDDLTPRELIASNRTVERFASRSLDDGFAGSREYALEAVDLLGGLAHPAKRYDAMSGLWLCMRSCCKVEDVVCYVHRYLLWLWFRPILETDPVFGPLSAGLYNYTECFFARLHLMPDDEDTRKWTRIALKCVFRDQDMMPLPIPVPIRAVERLLLPEFPRNKWFHARSMPLIDLRKSACAARSTSE